MQVLGPDAQLYDLEALQSLSRSKPRLRRLRLRVAASKMELLQLLSEGPWGPQCDAS